MCPTFTHLNSHAIEVDHPPHNLRACVRRHPLVDTIDEVVQTAGRLPDKPDSVSLLFIT